MFSVGYITEEKNRAFITYFVGPELN